jgi:hypothetical protein
MVMTPIAQRLRYSLKMIKRANTEHLKKIEDSFENTASQDLQATFDVVPSKWGKNERIRVTSDPVPGQKHPSLKATFSKGRQELESYAENSFLTGHGFGNMLSADVRSEHVSPRFILEPGNQVTKESCERYKEVLEVLKTRENVKRLTILAKHNVSVKLLRDGKFRVKFNQSASSLKFSTLKLSKRNNQSYEEFVTEGLKFASRAAVKNDNVSASLMLENGLGFNRKISSEGLVTFFQAKEIFSKEKARLRLGELEAAGVQVKLRHNNQITITRQDDGGRQVFSKVLHQQKNQPLWQFIRDAVTQAKWAVNAPLPKKEPGFMSRLFSKNLSKKPSSSLTSKNSSSNTSESLYTTSGRQVDDVFSNDLSNKASDAQSVTSKSMYTSPDKRAQDDPSITSASLYTTPDSQVNEQLDVQEQLDIDMRHLLSRDLAEEASFGSSISSKSIFKNNQAQEEASFSSSISSKSIFKNNQAQKQPSLLMDFSSPVLSDDSWKSSRLSI